MRKFYEIYLKVIITMVKIMASIVPIKNNNTVLIDILHRFKLTRRINIDLNQFIEFNLTSIDSIFRANTFLSKEPETLDWINTFNKNEVLWDIGANIGIYSLYAAKKGINVIAFEPSFANYSLLNRNLITNKIDKYVLAYNLAFSDRKIATYFNMGDTEEGGACSQIGGATETFNYSGLGNRKVVFNQGAICFTVDEAITELGIQFPNHIKIDVDGVEPLIIKGALNTLADNRVKSLLIEINEREISEINIVKTLEDLGFTYTRHIPTDKNYPYILNYIFRRQ